MRFIEPALPDFFGSPLTAATDVTSNERTLRIARAANCVTGAAIVALLCCAASAASVWFVLIGTAAEAIVAAGSFYAAFEAFDERIRRPPDTNTLI